MAAIIKVKGQMSENMIFQQIKLFISVIPHFWVILKFSNYGDVKQIYVNKLWETYIVIRHINRVFDLYKVESIITEAFSELFLVHGGHLE